MKTHSEIPRHMDEGEVFLHEMEEMKRELELHPKKEITHHMDEADVIAHLIMEEEDKIH